MNKKVIFETPKFLNFFPRNTKIIQAIREVIGMCVDVGMMVLISLYE
jgi:hypothetical protein